MDGWVSAMSLRHAVLGLLARRPSTGYELTGPLTAAEGAFGDGFELDELADFGLSVIPGPRTSRP